MFGILTWLICFIALAIATYYLPTMEKLAFQSKDLKDKITASLLAILLLISWWLWISAVF